MQSDQEPRPLAVLLGASNLTRGLPAAVAAARQRAGGALDVLVATGHGRSYGAWSSVLGRGLPGIHDCGIWDALAARAPTKASQPLSGGPDSPTRFALITDVGNDVGYGFRPETIADWVDACAARLATAGFRGVISRLPLEHLRELPRWRLRLAARLFFPRLRLGTEELLRSAEQLERNLDDVARRHGFARFGLGPRWYGPDGIHIWRWNLSAAWTALLAEPLGGRTASPPFAGPVDRWRLTVTMPERYRWLGGEREGRGRCRLRDGTRVELF